MTHEEIEAQIKENEEKGIMTREETLAGIEFNGLVWGGIGILPAGSTTVIPIEKLAEHRAKEAAMDAKAEADYEQMLLEDAERRKRSNEEYAEAQRLEASRIQRTDLNTAQPDSDKSETE